MPNGILAIHKPAGCTSHDVVMKVRRLLKTKKVGHTGTLDPDVTGVLPICIGRATKVVQFLTDCDKEYECCISIGLSTTTEDAGGEKVEEDLSEKNFGRSQIEEVLQSFVGELSQVPPIYSAVKVNGKKLYEYARQGIEVERPIRQVNIHEIILLSEEENFAGETVEFSFRVKCSKGTYIRTLAVDIGKKLGYPAHMARLIRTKSGSFQLSDCITLDQLKDAVDSDQVDNHLYPVERGIIQLPHITLGQGEIEDVKNGKKLRLPETFSKHKWIGIFNESGTCYGIYEPQEDGDYRAVRVLISANEEM